MLYILGAGAMVLTIASYGLKIKQLALIAAIMWGAWGGYCFSQSTATWDIYYVIGFVGMFAMVGEGYQAWGFMTKKEETEDDNELGFEALLEKTHNDRKQSKVTKAAEAEDKKEAKELRESERAAKRFGIR